MITMTITGETPDEFKAQLGWLYSKFNAGEVIADVKSRLETEKALNKAIKKAPEPVAPEPVGVPAGESTGQSPAAAAPTSADKAEVQKLASAKSKLVGVEKVKETIAKFGGKNINETAAEQMVALRDALEALTA